MEHVADTYNQIQSLGIEKLREEYATAEVTLKQQRQVRPKRLTASQTGTEDPALMREFMSRLTVVAAQTDGKPA